MPKRLRDVPKRLLALALLAAAGLVLWRSGALAALTPETFVAWLRAAGPWGQLLFLALFSGLQAGGVPGFVFLLTAIAVWPDRAFFLNWAGAVGAGTVGYVFARWIARDWVMARVPARVHRFDTRLAARGLRTVILIRIVFYLFTPSHWALGLSRVRFRDMLLGSVVGFAPPTALATFLGVSLFDWLAAQPRELWLAAAALALAALAALRLLRRTAPRTPGTG